jgi:hypothetical protein
MDPTHAELPPPWLVSRLRLTTDADPSSLARILRPFQNLNVGLPRFSGPLDSNV